jgi:hypothetical protein
MVDHSVREHAVWSASATARNWTCPGALTLSLQVPESTSIYADTGTAVHQISERCLRSGGDASEYLGTIEKTKRHDIEITEELVMSAQTYIDYCREQIAKASDYWIEERFSLADLDPPFEAGGTGDFTAYFGNEEMLEIVDLKNGTGVVDAKGNPQMRSYALGALLKHPDLNVQQVRTTIVQPRAFAKGGAIRSETFHVADLIEWAAELLQAMGRSKQAADAYEACGSNSILLDEWADRWLIPGKCTFCPVEGKCPKLRKKALEAAAVFFEPETDQPKIGNSALDDSPEAVERDLDMLDMIEDWIKARRALAHDMAEAGIAFENYYLADKIGNRKFVETDETKLVASLKAAGIAEDQIYERKVRTAPGIEKVIGKKKMTELSELVHKPVTGKNLVRSDKTTRPPAKSKAEQFIETE